MLQTNTKVPNFSTINQDGEIISNATLLGKKYILFFYGQDDTPTCSKQVFSANDMYDAISAKGYALYGVSPDKEKKHKKFIEKYDLKLQLLADPSKEMMYAFEAYGPKIFMGKEVIGVYRKAYVINEEGNIIHIISEVTAATQGQQLMEIL